MVEDTPTRTHTQHTHNTHTHFGDAKGGAAAQQRADVVALGDVVDDHKALRRASVTAAAGAAAAGARLCGSLVGGRQRARLCIVGCDVTDSLFAGARLRGCVWRRAHHLVCAIARGAPSVCAPMRLSYCLGRLQTMHMHYVMPSIQALGEFLIARRLAKENSAQAGKTLL